MIKVLRPAVVLVAHRRRRYLRELTQEELNVPSLTKAHAGAKRGPRTRQWSAKRAVLAGNRFHQHGLFLLPMKRLTYKHGHLLVPQLIAGESLAKT